MIFCIFSSEKGSLLKLDKGISSNRERIEITALSMHHTYVGTHTITNRVCKLTTHNQKYYEQSDRIPRSCLVTGPAFEWRSGTENLF